MDLSNDDYVINEIFKLIDLIIEYYDLHVLDLESLSEGVKHFLIEDEEEWVEQGEHFPNGIPTKINEYMLELLEENDFIELFNETESNYYLLNYLFFKK